MQYDYVSFPVTRADYNRVLEDMIDYESLGEILGRIASIASDKAGHIRGNWGDKNLALGWDRASNKLLVLAEECEL